MAAERQGEKRAKVWWRLALIATLVFSAVYAPMTHAAMDRSQLLSVHELDAGGAVAQGSAIVSCATLIGCAAADVPLIAGKIGSRAASRFQPAQSYPPTHWIGAGLDHPPKQVAYA